MKKLQMTFYAVAAYSMFLQPAHAQPQDRTLTLTRAVILPGLISNVPEVDLASGAGAVAYGDECFGADFDADSGFTGFVRQEVFAAGATGTAASAAIDSSTANAMVMMLATAHAPTPILANTVVAQGGAVVNGIANSAYVGPECPFFTQPTNASADGYGYSPTSWTYMIPAIDPNGEPNAGVTLIGNMWIFAVGGGDWGAYCLDPDTGFICPVSDPRGTVTSLVTIGATAELVAFDVTPFGAASPTFEVIGITENSSEAVPNPAVDELQFNQPMAPAGYNHFMRFSEFIPSTAPAPELPIAMTVFTSLSINATSNSSCECELADSTNAGTGAWGWFNVLD